jgi:hypothetical protein
MRLATRTGGSAATGRSTVGASSRRRSLHRAFQTCFFRCMVTHEMARACVGVNWASLDSAIAGSWFKMADITRSVAWRLWAAVLLHMLVHLVRAATIEDQSTYQSCLTTPSTCISLCASLRLPFRRLQPGHRPFERVGRSARVSGPRGQPSHLHLPVRTVRDSVPIFLKPPMRSKKQDSGGRLLHTRQT